MTRFAVQRGNQLSGSDDLADRWYIVDREADAIDKRGRGFATRAEALDMLVERVQMRGVDEAGNLTDRPDWDLVGVAEIAQRTGVAVATVQSWRRRHPDDFPAPIVQLAAGPVWSWGSVAAWVTIPRRPGRPRKG
jgi:hypothetical protein